MDDVGGDRIPGDTLGYTSGFNVVQDYFYKSEEGGWSTEVVKDFLRAAKERHLKVMISLPAIEDVYLPAQLQVPLPGRRHFFQRDPPNYQPATSLIRAISSDSSLNTAVYGWYLVDEPTNVLWSEVGLLDTSVGGFHVTVVSASKLRQAYNMLRAQADSTRPYVWTNPDFSTPDFTNRWCARPPGDYWRWDNAWCGGLGNPPADFPDPCHPAGAPITLTQDYRGTSDIVHCNTYLNAGFGIVSENQRWQDRLRQIDEIGHSAIPEILIGCGLGCNPAPKCASVATPGCARFGFSDLRYHAYSSIVHGARGVWFWSYGNTYDSCINLDPCQRHGPASPYFIENLVPLSLELDSLSAYFTDQATEIGRRRWPDNTTGPGSLPAIGGPAANIHCALLARGKGVVFIAVNVDSAATSTLTFDFKALNASLSKDLIMTARSAEVLFESTRLSTPVSNGVISETFPPFGVKILRFKRREVPG